MWVVHRQKACSVLLPREESQTEGHRQWSTIDHPEGMTIHSILCVYWLLNGTQFIKSCVIAIQQLESVWRLWSKHGGLSQSPKSRYKLSHIIASNGNGDNFLSTVPVYAPIFQWASVPHWGQGIHSQWTHNMAIENTRQLLCQQLQTHSLTLNTS